MSRQVSRSRKLVLLGAILFPACSATDVEPEVPPEPKTPFECELGVERGGVFEPGGPQCEAELTLGFQGFLWFEVVVRAGPGAPRAGKATLSVAVGDDEPVDFGAPQVVFGPYGADGLRLSSHMHVFLSGHDPADLADRLAQVTVRLESDTRQCIVSSRVLMVDQDDCIHTNEAPCENTDVMPDG